MKHKNLALTLGLIALGSFIVLVSCKKINDYTTLGGALVPEVDGINTFDTIIDIRAYNDTFSLSTDSTNYGSSFTQYLGHIENDPLFGKTDALMSFELKPAAFRYTFSDRPDSLHIDSIVLVLDYVDTYGDTLTNQTVNVYEVGNTFTDTAYKVREYTQTRLGLLGSRTFQPLSLNDSVKAYQDTTVNQLRIRLDDSFGARLLGYDTTTATGRIAAYISDSTFRQSFKGFTLESTGGNAIMGFNLAGANSKLAIYYKDDHGDPSDVPAATWDTRVAYFTFAGNSNSASANYIHRDYANTGVAALSNGVTGDPDNELFIQSTPGTFAVLKIPGLNGLSNRVVHRAEIIAEQIYAGPTDSLFSTSNLYVDAYDPALSGYRVLPYDVTVDLTTGSNNLNAFGIVPYTAPDPVSNPIKVWHFNITRYVQNVVNGTLPVYDLRLYEPVYTIEQYKALPASTPVAAYLGVNEGAGKGRVLLHGGGDGSLPAPDPQRLRLRIVYSKL